jgi:serine/threonine-protein kinase
MDTRARLLADLHDRKLRDPSFDLTAYLREHPELCEEAEALAEIDRLLDDPAPERLSGYRITGELGAGGMGRVFLAFDERLGREVAIKTLSPRYAGSPELRARFMQEARAMARVNHPNVARIYSLGADDEPPHFVMERVEGAPLTRAASSLDYEHKAALMRKVALAVQSLHDHGLLHRDLKPGNILVGPDVEPKLLDFGLALESAGTRLTSPGEVIGTPEYFSPEHAMPGTPQDARTDVFSLGAVMYELLTGTLPFAGEGIEQQMRLIRDADPALPRRINPDIPGDLQNVCLKALEKNPADRYASAREFAADLERYLAGEPVVAAPAAYGRMMSGKAAQHVREIEGWRRDRLLTEPEYDAFRKAYERLVEREDAWIMEVRRLSLPQVALYFGAWVAAVGAALIVLFRYAALAGAPAVLITAAATAVTAVVGVRHWRAGVRTVAVAFLMAACLLLPIAVLVAMGEAGIGTGGVESREMFLKLPSFKHVTNAQIWWALLLALPAYFWVRRFTQSDVFSVPLSAGAALLCLATLLRLGLVEWIESDPGRPFLNLVPCAVLFLAVGLLLERARRSGDAKYFYPVSVVFMYAALSGVAALHEPWANWLNAVAPWTRGQAEYLFLINAGAYLCLQFLCDRFDSPQMRAMGKAYRFVIPGHVLTPLLILGMDAPEGTAEARIFEILLPLAACAFVFASVPKQMKNFFATGLLFLAIGVVRLQQNLLKDRASWPVLLLVLGLAVMLGATRYTQLKLRLRAILGAKRRFPR